MCPLSRRLRGGISETCDLSSCFHVTNCLGLGFYFVFKSPHTLCPPVLSTYVVIGNSFISSTCFPISVHPSCYIMFLKLTAFRHCNCQASKTFIHLVEACFAAIPPLLVWSQQRGSNFHVISLKQPALNRSNSLTATCMSASCQRFHSSCMQPIQIWTHCLNIQYNGHTFRGKILHCNQQPSCAIFLPKRLARSHSNYY